MREIKVLRVYNLVDSKGNKLQLRLGVLQSRAGEACISNADKGYRWSFIGEHIPMPVRSMTWFNGFPENTMLEWLKGNGWALRSCVMDDGRATVYEMPFVDSKGNEITNATACAKPNECYKSVFNDVLCDLIRSGKRITAVRVYRYVHGGTLQDCTNAVKAICKDVWY